jgi:hypothetical protein
MARRRRLQREIAFSFDSFLDVVANVVGIILRLILVAWMGGRSYKAAMPTMDLPPIPVLAEPTPPPAPTDERQPLLVRHRRELGAQQKALVGKTVERESMRSVVGQLRLDLEALSAKCQAEEEQAATAAKAAERQAKAVHSVRLSEKQLREQVAKLQTEVEALRRLPSLGKEFRYRTPISAALQTHELMFECKAGRVTLINTEALVGIMRRESKAQAEQLRSQWQLTPTTAPVGAFRLRYTLERERSLLSGPAGGTPVDGAFRYTRTRWEVEPITTDRGESGDKAFVEGSDFRKVIDELDKQTTAVTLWVYPDSFVLYRQLRDFMHDRDVVVAGRPLPEGMPIASSSQGTVSRGQ